MVTLATAPATGSRTDKGSTRVARRKERRPSTCWPAARQTHSSSPQPPWPTRATSPSPWKSSPRACSGIPDSSELAELRQTVLVRLMEQRQLLDPFGFLVYAEFAGAELSPVR